jgi:hypothetical protein
VAHEVDGDRDSMHRSTVIRRESAILLGIAFAIAACQGPVASSNPMVQVVNLGSEAASFHWQSPGFLGTALFGPSGTEPVRGCDVYRRGFDPGPHEITITTASDALSLAASAPTNAQVDYSFVIRSDGTIERLDSVEAAPTPTC